MVQVLLATFLFYEAQENCQVEVSHLWKKVTYITTLDTDWVNNKCSDSVPIKQHVRFSAEVIVKTQSRPMPTD